MFPNQASCIALALSLIILLPCRRVLIVSMNIACCTLHAEAADLLTFVYRYFPSHQAEINQDKKLDTVYLYPVPTLVSLIAGFTSTADLAFSFSVPAPDCGTLPIRPPMHITQPNVTSLSFRFLFLCSVSPFPCSLSFAKT